jgi:hypothetical protein
VLAERIFLSLQISEILILFSRLWTNGQRVQMDRGFKMFANQGEEKSLAKEEEARTAKV